MIFNSIKSYLLIGIAMAVLGLGITALHHINVLKNDLVNEQTAHQKTVDTLTTRTEERDSARIAGKLCSDGVTRMQDAASAAAAAAKPIIDKAKVEQKAHGERAQIILSTPATKPDDMCQSVQDRAVRWQKEKAQQ